MRIACWSGPRNISTAMMRSFGSRADCHVTDEPLYAAYLADTGKDHPMRDAVLASQPTDWRTVADVLRGPIPDGKPVRYDKQMAHHLLPDRFGDWLTDFTHVLLVRDPTEMLASLLEAWPDAELEDTGLLQQRTLLDWLAEHTDQRPPIVDGRAVQDDPEPTLRALCDAIGIPWDPAMLSWPAGPHPADGAWAPHWYAGVWASTGFQPWADKPRHIPTNKQRLLDQCVALHREISNRA